MKNSPKYTLAKRTKPSYPTSICYVTSMDTPGPGSYGTKADFSKNDAPAFSFGHKDTKKSEEQGPAPNVYKVEENPIQGARRSPAFSMAKRLETKQSNNPGPGTYTIKPLESTTPKYTMSGRRNKAKHEFSTPAPNAYGTCKTPAKKEHVTLKSRASPHVYSGFQTNKFDDRVELILV
ncbi:hypothetical protein CHS0354_013391 [Potamilus streckersoni]|uniref:Outer dense fiber protein 3 n=1 Tax=Potamilus streckersoni TaxID=2493646 RepID=A0AAE0RWK5_9BIVA|nr:hypothetical protein CHS0354_013391 [Potamilus streckersoni]